MTASSSSSTPASSSQPVATLWGARPAAASPATTPRQGILLSRERSPSGARPTSPPPPATKEGEEGTKSDPIALRDEDNRTTGEKNESEATPRGEKSESGGKERVDEAGGAEQLLDVSEETEQQRESCPDGVECRSEDPRHFILFLHTARDEFSVPSSTPPASFGNRSFQFTSINSAEGFDSGGMDNHNNDSGDPAPDASLTGKRAMLRRSVSCDSGLKRELSLPNLGGLALGSGGGSTANRSDEKSGWLHKRAALRKNWTCYWFVLRPQTRQLLYYKIRADTTAQGKGPEGSVWLEDANTVPAPESDERSHCFRLTTPRKTLQLSASNEESKWSWIRAIAEASRGKTSTAGDLSSSGIGKGRKASGNGSLPDISASLRQLPTGSAGTPGDDGSASGEQHKNEDDEKKRKEKKREKNAEAYGRKIDWTGRDLKTLPEKLYEFANFDGLTKLVVRANQLSAFPGELSMLRGLTYLDYSENLIKELPKEIGAMYRLKELHLESNRLEQLPPELGKLTRLMVLNIGNGQDWFNLVEVQRSANKIRSLPGELADMLQLRSFDCSNNAISSVPYAFLDRCTKLVKLDLTGNQITRLPGSLGRLVRLEKLLLSRNKLEVLPPQVGWLRALKLLHLMDNKLTRLPPQVGQCERLEQLYMEDNPIKDPPRQVFKLELTELLLYLSDLNKGEEQCFRTRVVLLGDEEKDKLLKAITGKTAAGGSSPLTVASATLKLKHGRLPAGASPTLDVWSVASDVNGPLLELESPLPRLVLTDEVVVILTIRFDAIDADTLDRWFTMLRANSPHSAVLVLAHAVQPFPPAQHREILNDLKAKCNDRKGDLNVALVDLVSFKGAKDAKALVPVTVDIALRHIDLMGRPVQRGVLQLEQILSSGCVDMSDLDASLPTLLVALSSNTTLAPVMSVAAWADLCALCGVMSEEQRAHALKVLASWGALVRVPAGVMAKDTFIVPSAPWLLSQLIKPH